jgi:hypothetical protein
VPFIVQFTPLPEAVIEFGVAASTPFPIESNTSDVVVSVEVGFESVI